MSGTGAVTVGTVAAVCNNPQVVGITANDEECIEVTGSLTLVDDINAGTDAALHAGTNINLNTGSVTVSGAGGVASLLSDTGAITDDAADVERFLEGGDDDGDRAIVQHFRASRARPQRDTRPSHG